MKVFIHIPKNGGTSLRHKSSPTTRMIIESFPRTTDIPKQTDIHCQLLSGIYGQQPGTYHARWLDFKKQYHHLPAFAVIRNPWSRVVSRYEFGKRRKNVPTSLQLSPEMTFEDFISQREKMMVPYMWLRAVRSWYQQLDYITDEHGKVRCDILRFEHYDEDITQYLGINIQNTEQKNTAPDKKQYTEYYTDETREIIAEWYKQDIEYFGFTFDGPATKNIWNNEINST